MRLKKSVLVMVCLLITAALNSAPWKLAWSDEFNGPEGSAPDPQNWVYDLGGNGWGNHEPQSYTDSRENSFMDGKGNLVIQALKRTTVGKDGIRQPFSSARIKSKGLRTFKYGFIEGRMQMPYGQGIWPAFWMMGEDIDTKKWPACGEIDIMEHLGKEPTQVHGTLHGPGYSGSNSMGKGYTLKDGTRFKDGFHTFAIEWDRAGIRFFVDRKKYHEVTPAMLKGKPWVFDGPFFFILNLAAGGDWPGQPDRSTRFPQRFLIDYIRVYSR